MMLFGFLQGNNQVYPCAASAKQYLFTEETYPFLSSHVESNTSALSSIWIIFALLGF